VNEDESPHQHALAHASACDKLNTRQSRRVFSLSHDEASMSRSFWLPGLLFTLLLAVDRAHAEEPTFPGLVKREFIYEKAPFPQCHASTIERALDRTKLKPGATNLYTLVAAWFGGTKEKDPDVGIWVSRFEDDQWTEPVEVANGMQPDGKRHPTWNPVLYQPRESRAPLMLFYKVGPDPKTWWGMVMTSRDAGKTWSEPTKLPEGIFGPIKNKPVLLEDNDENGNRVKLFSKHRVISPTSTEDHGWRVHFEVGKFTGQGTLWYDWTATKPINTGKDFGAIQPTVLIHPEKKLQALCRTQNGVIAETWSEDGSETWSELKATKLPNANSGIDAVSLSDGRHLLIYNHVDPGLIPKGWGKRSPLNLAITRDGKEWQAVGVLEDTKGEYSYPAIIQTADGLVHMTYTWQRTKVRHVVVDPAKLVATPMPEGKWPKELAQ
jgi:predicted neuraminidase